MHMLIRDSEFILSSILQMKIGMIFCMSGWNLGQSLTPSSMDGLVNNEHYSDLQVGSRIYRSTCKVQRSTYKVQKKLVEKNGKSHRHLNLAVVG